MHWTFLSLVMWLIGQVFVHSWIPLLVSISTPFMFPCLDSKCLQVVVKAVREPMPELAVFVVLRSRRPALFITAVGGC